MFEKGDRVIIIGDGGIYWHPALKHRGKIGTIIKPSDYKENVFLIRMDDDFDLYMNLLRVGSAVWVSSDNLELFIEKQFKFENLDKENWWED